MKNEQASDNFSFANIVQPRDELSSMVGQRSNEYVFARVSKEDTIVGGWELDKELQSSKKIKKKKEMWRRFEDKLWLLLNAFEFEEFK